MKNTKLFLALAIAMLMVACENTIKHTADSTICEIKGSLNNVPDGTLLMLFNFKDYQGRMIAMDSVQDGSFYFKVTPETTETERYMLACVRNKNFSPLGLHIWATAGDFVHIKGDNSLILTWQVDARAPENAVMGKYIKQSKALWNRRQEILIERNQLPEKVKVEQLAEKAQQLIKEEDSLMILTAANDLRIMRKSKVDEIWLEKFNANAITASKIKNFPYTEELRKLYNQLTEEQQAHRFAKEAYAALFTSQQAENSEKVTDGELFDLDGNIHTLSELQGKYILLDFWAKGCSPCMQALSELGILAEMYKEKLSIVSISTDTDDVWREASKEHNITWHNWSDGKGENGMFALYGKGGIPLFVLISPDGNIIKVWRGYSKGGLTNNLKGIIE